MATHRITADDGRVFHYTVYDEQAAAFSVGGGMYTAPITSPIAPPLRLITERDTRRIRLTDEETRDLEFCNLGKDDLPGCYCDNDGFVYYTPGGGSLERFAVKIDAFAAAPAATTGTMPATQRLTARDDKVYGAVFGQAVGDALGLGTEFLSKEEVGEYYPGGLRSYGQIVQDYHRSRWERGDWTDDTDLMLCVARAVLRNKAVVPEAVAGEFLKWFHGKPMGIGSHVFKVLSSPDYQDSPAKIARAVWEASGRESAPNGAVMRTSVIGLIGGDVARNAETVCRLTHYDPRCVGSCVIVSLLIDALIHGRDMSADEIVAIGQRYDRRIEAFVDAARSPDIAALKLGEEPGIGYTLKTLGAGLWTYFNCGGFKEGLLAVVNEGGDADTNAAVACAILGAKFGLKGIPAEYIDGLVKGEYLHRSAGELCGFNAHMEGSK